MEGLDVLEKRKICCPCRYSNRPANSLEIMPACRQFNFKVSNLSVSKNGDLLAICRQEVGNSSTTSFYIERQTVKGRQKCGKCCNRRNECVLRHGKSNANTREQISCPLSQRAVPDRRHRPDPARVPQLYMFCT
jgi:hypothetical protein